MPIFYSALGRHLRNDSNDIQPLQITKQTHLMTSRSQLSHRIVSGCKHLQSLSDALPCSLRMLSFKFTLRSPFFRMPITMSYDRPGCACSAFVKAARSVCDATTSRLSNYNNPIQTWKLVICNKQWRFWTFFFLCLNDTIVRIASMEKWNTCDRIGRKSTGKTSVETGVSSLIVIVE